MDIIARVHNDFSTKFGIPRQSGLVDAIKSTIVFEPDYRNITAVRGLEDFSHIWVLWEFSQAVRKDWSPTVRPPRLGGNKRIGVFATRSPFRPNPIGLSCVKLEYIDFDCKNAPVLHIAGTDMLDSTPVYDIKPYIPYADCHPEATGGYTETVERKLLEVIDEKECLKQLPDNMVQALYGILANDPRPAYQDFPDRVYGFEYGGYEIKFSVKDGILQVISVTGIPNHHKFC